VAVNVGDADVSVLIADAQHRPLIDGVRADLRSVRHFLSEDETDGWRSADNGQRAASDRHPMPFHIGQGDRGVEATMQQNQSALLQSHQRDDVEAAYVELTHGNLWWNNTNAMHNIDVLADDVTLAAAPLFRRCSACRRCCSSWPSIRASQTPTCRACAWCSAAERRAPSRY
jgi:fatty-acyl-CoA synthase